MRSWDVCAGSFLTGTGSRYPELGLQCLCPPRWEEARLAAPGPLALSLPPVLLNWG